MSYRFLHAPQWKRGTLKMLLVIISDAEIGGSSYLAQSAVNIFTFNTSRPRFCQPSSVAYVCCQGRPMCAWTCYDDGAHTHLLLTSSCLPHLLHMMQLHTDRSLPPSLPRRHSVVAGCWVTGASTCSRGTVGIPSQQAGCPDSNNSDQRAHVLHEVCALRRLLCTSFNTSITNFCPFVSQTPHRLRSFCSSGMFFLRRHLWLCLNFLWKSQIRVKITHYGSHCGSDWSSYLWQWGAGEPGHPHRSALLPWYSSSWSTRSAWNDQIKY